MSGFEVDPVRVQAAASGIQAIVADMASIGVDRVVGPAAQYGHEGLHAAFGEFCARWQLGMTALLADAGTLADGLAAVSERYARSDGEFSVALGPPTGSAGSGGR